ncbi:hypothetical protein [Eisenbergiella massiliensis]|nr:hypothetical protein [Eisenbergiella massiliensis]
MRYNRRLRYHGKSRTVGDSCLDTDGRREGNGRLGRAALRGKRQ